MKKSLIRLLTLLIVASTCLVGCSGNDEPVFIPAYKDVNGDSATKSTKETSAEPTDTQKVSGKRVALTFDDGPHNVYTKKIVDELSRYGYNATFFVVGNRVDGTNYNGGEALKYAADAGNELAIHGYTHETYYDACSNSVYKSELSKTEAAIRAKAPSASVRLMRPIGGKITDARVKSCKYSVIMWSVDSEDWKNQYSLTDSAVQKAQKVDTIVDNVMDNVSSGSIILMHDIYESTYDAAVIILKELHAQGYEIVTVSELLGSGASAGKKYFKAS